MMDGWERFSELAAASAITQAAVETTLVIIAGRWRHTHSEVSLPEVQT